MPNPAATPLVSRAYEKLGHFASREGISRDAGHMGRNTGCPGKYGTVGNPIDGHNNSLSKITITSLSHTSLELIEKLHRAIDL